MATKKPSKKAQAKKTAAVMHEFKTHSLHSGKGGPVVTNRKQAVAIAISEAARMGKKHSVKKGK